MSLKWYGENVAKRMERAARVGINRTMAVCVKEAKETHQFTNRTGTAERSIRIANAAQTFALKTWGMWGSVAVHYFVYLEFGTKNMKSKSALTGVGPLKPNSKGKSFAPWKGGSYAATLRPVAIRVYPILGEMIRRAYAEAA